MLTLVKLWNIFKNIKINSIWNDHCLTTYINLILHYSSSKFSIFQLVFDQLWMIWFDKFLVFLFSVIDLSVRSDFSEQLWIFRNSVCFSLSFPEIWNVRIWSVMESFMNYLLEFQLIFFVTLKFTEHLPT